MDTMNAAWRCHKCRTKSKVFTAQDNSQPIELPKTVPNGQLNELIQYWNDSDIKVCNLIYNWLLLYKIHFYITDTKVVYTLSEFIICS